jgi:DNA mismatch repair protein MSH6
MKIIDDDSEDMKITTPTFKQEVKKNKSTTNTRDSTRSTTGGKQNKKGANNIDNDSDNSSTSKVKPKKKKSDNSLSSDIVYNDAFANPENGLPDFLKPENIKDINLKSPNDPNYDPTTLFIPDAYIKKATPSMQQYWSFKRDNFDKVLLFKLGKFYEMFYDDAIVGNQVLELRWMGNDPNKLHVGFPEKVLEERAAVLVQNGFKVAVIEQTEKLKDKEERLEKTNNKRSSANDKLVKRELCNVLTKGTYIAPNSNSYSNKYCVALSVRGLTWGFVVFDVSTLNFYFGELNETDENTYTQIMTFLYNIRPEEVIVMKGNLPNYVINFITSLTSKPQLSVLKSDYNLISLQKLCKKYFGEDITKWNEIISNILMNETNFHSSCAALYITINYLEKILLAEQCLTVGNFKEYYTNVIVNDRLIMDYQAVTNLELVETKLDPKAPERGSLLDYMNKAITPFGKRMFRLWLLNPLTNVNVINERLDIIDELIKNDNILINFRTALAKWPDIERQCSKIYKFAIQTASKAVYFEDISRNRLQEFFNIINFLKGSIGVFKIFEKMEIKSKRLHQMVTFADDGGFIPDLKNILDEFTNKFVIKYGEGGNVQVEPCKGVYEAYDNLKNSMLNIEEELDEILQAERKRLKCNKISYVHTKCHKYELEVPEDAVSGNKKPSEYKMTTSRKGFLRFHTEDIVNLVKQLENVDEKLRSETTRFNYILFKKFYEQNGIFDQYIRNIAELDCLFSLAYVAMNVCIIVKFLE